MKQNKLMVIIISILVLSNLSIYFYYQNNAEALSFEELGIILSSATNTIPELPYKPPILKPNEYSIQFTSIDSIKTIESQENQKGCEKLYTDFTKEDGSEGYLIFTCSRDNESALPDPLIILSNRVDAIEKRLDDAKIP